LWCIRLEEKRSDSEDISGEFARLGGFGQANGDRRENVGSEKDGEVEAGCEWDRDHALVEALDAFFVVDRTGGVDGALVTHWIVDGGSLSLEMEPHRVEWVDDQADEHGREVEDGLAQEHIDESLLELFLRDVLLVVLQVLNQSLDVDADRRSPRATQQRSRLILHEREQGFRHEVSGNVEEDVRFESVEDVLIGVLDPLVRLDHRSASILTELSQLPSAYHRDGMAERHRGGRSEDLRSDIRGGLSLLSSLLLLLLLRRSVSGQGVGEGDVHASDGSVDQSVDHRSEGSLLESGIAVELPKGSPRVVVVLNISRVLSLLRLKHLRELLKRWSERIECCHLC